MAAAQNAPSQVDASAQPAAPANLFQDQANQLGAHRCADVFGALGRVLTQGTSYGAQTEVNSAAPEQGALQGVTGMTYDLPDLKGQAAGVVFAVPTAEGCQGNLVRVAPFPKSCEDMATVLPAGSTAAGDLSGVSLYNVPSNRDRILLVPNGASCIVVTVNQTAQQG